MNNDTSNMSLTNSSGYHTPPEYIDIIEPHPPDTTKHHLSTPATTPTRVKRKRPRVVIKEDVTTHNIRLSINDEWIITSNNTTDVDIFHPQVFLRKRIRPP
jgi:hypothetical protein